VQCRASNSGGTCNEKLSKSFEIFSCEKYHVEMRALQERCRAAESINKNNALFFAKICHELRTPLTAILGISDIIIDKGNDDDCVGLVRKINVSGNMLLRTLNDLLDISKMNAGRLQFECSPFKPEAVAAQVADLFRAEAQKKGLQIAVEISTDCIRLRMGDSHRIAQVLNNIISNSVKFTSSGTISILVENFPERPLVFTIRDTGIGMSKEQLQKLYNEYEQADIYTQKEFGGTGLGMSIVRDLVLQMGGEIQVQSMLKEGTHTRVSLPLPNFKDRRLPPRDVKLTEISDALNWKGLRALVADDCEMNREILCTLLQNLGIETTQAEGGLKAIEIYKEKQFDLIFLDINMPDMDGMTVLREISGIRQAAGVSPGKFIAFTANAMSHEVQALLDSGFDSHLAKPFKKEDLLRDLARVIDKQGHLRKIELLASQT
jgi:CheY-like chemotaxis protein/nitrogen-specific signal transduction histidine kinase